MEARKERLVLPMLLSWQKSNQNKWNKRHAAVIGHFIMQ